MEPLRLVSEDADGDIAAQLRLDRESFSPIDLNRILRSPLWGLAQLTGTVCMQADSLAAGFSLQHGLHERLV